MVEWKPILIGTLISLALSLVIGLVMPQFFLIGIIIGCALVGYLTGGKVEKGIVYGMLTGLLSGAIYGILIGILVLFVSSTIFGGGTTGDAIIISSLFTMLGFVIYIILTVISVISGLIGGLIGALIKRATNESIKSDETPEFTPPTINFTMENIQKCLCTSCPVQENSNCIQEKNMILDDKISQGDLMLDADETPALYCLTGETDCSDIDTAKNCICLECPVYKEYQLDNRQPPLIFCQVGESE